ncbi:MAG: hypothetical protein K0A95_06100 [Chromatiales bacterium]|nr:hypothetical protein [Gammaproteobacteria bacterium]MBW6476626.1 hypothetical protein [Chromatiales bacterium]
MSKLLDELDSLHALLKEESAADLTEAATPPASPPESAPTSASSEKLIEELKAFYASQREAAEAAAQAEQEAEHAAGLADTTETEDSPQAHANIPLLEDIASEFETGQIPVLDEVVEEGAFQTAIPVLDEVVDSLDPHEETTTPHSPNAEELLALVETLVDRRLERLRPQITEQVLEELQAIYPGLERDLRPS